MPLVDAQWLCSRYADFVESGSPPRSVLLARGVSRRHGGRAGRFR